MRGERDNQAFFCKMRGILVKTLHNSHFNHNIADENLKLREVSKKFLFKNF